MHTHIRRTQTHMHAAMAMLTITMVDRVAVPVVKYTDAMAKCLSRPSYDFGSLSLSPSPAFPFSAFPFSQSASHKSLPMFFLRPMFVGQEAI